MVNGAIHDTRTIFQQVHYSDVIMGTITHHYLLNRLFRQRSKKASKLRATGLCAGNSPVTGEIPAQMVSNAENVSIWWRHESNNSMCMQRRAIQWGTSPARHCWEYYHLKVPNIIYKQRVLMHRHQGWNVRHGLCHIYMRYIYIYELFIAFVCFVVCSLL